MLFQGSNFPHDLSGKSKRIFFNSKRFSRVFFRISRCVVTVINFLFSPLLFSGFSCTTEFKWGRKVQIAKISDARNNLCLKGLKVEFFFQGFPIRYWSNDFPRTSIESTRKVYPRKSLANTDRTRKRIESRGKESLRKFYWNGVDIRDGDFVVYSMFLRNSRQI